MGASNPPPFSTGNQPESSSFDGFDGGPPASDAVDADALDADATPRQGSQASSASSPTGDGGSRGAAPCPPASGWASGLSHLAMTSSVGFSALPLAISGALTPGTPFD